MFFCKLFRMADDDLPSKIFGSNEREDNDDTNLPQHIHLDLGDDTSRNPQLNRLGSQNSGSSGSGANEGQKREDNPFSFKHFLQSDSGNNYQNKGAKPKVYCESRSVPAPSNSDIHNKIPELKQSRIVPEFSSALPDFVQDHLVIEQCYLGNNSSGNYNLELNNLPDFTRNRDRQTFEKSSGGEPASSISKPIIPLDLPIRPEGSFPLDLPIGNSSNASSRNCPTVSEVGNSKSLPDFLADSAVCSQKNETLSVPHSPESESERLRHELDMTRRQLAEQTRLCESLSRELEIARNKEYEYTQNLAKALEQVEHNLEKSNRKAASAEGTVLKLKQEVKSLMMQINNLKMENQSLRGDEAAGGQDYFNPINELHSHRLAQELRSAASSAEHSLRQLLTGVDNLRIMAATLENMHRIEEKNDPFSNFDEDIGPAL